MKDELSENAKLNESKREEMLLEYIFLSNSKFLKCYSSNKFNRPNLQNRKLKQKILAKIEIKGNLI